MKSGKLFIAILASATFSNCSAQFQETDLEDFEITPNPQRSEQDVIKKDGPPPPPRLNLRQDDVPDKDVKPLVVFHARMPADADRSGRCHLRFDVDTKGVPLNIEIIECTHSMFEKEAVSAVEQYKYRRKIVDGESVSRSSVETEVKFTLVDESGNILPE